MIASNLIQLLTSLCTSEVDFIIVGGLAAVLNGAPIQTYDLDVVYSRQEANVELLLKLLPELDAIFRIQPHRKLRPNATHLSGHGQMNLITRFGPFDLLATVGNRLYYDDLLPDSELLDLGENLKVRVLKLETIIALKEQLGHPKDLAALPALRQTLRERTK